jgi:predicted TIM-barrel fold metal-dependent hydrolase
MEPLSMWREYLPEEWRSHAPYLAPITPIGEPLAARVRRLGEHALLPAPDAPTVDGKPLLRGLSEVACIESVAIAELRQMQLKEGESAAGQLTDMDRNGIDVAVMLPTYAPFLVFNDEIPAARSRAYAAAYNRWLRDLCAVAPDRMLPAALLSRHDPELIVSDLEHELAAGCRAVVLRPNPVLGRTLGSPDYARFWACCEYHGLPVLLHEGTHTRVATAGADRYTTHFGQHACSHPMEAMMALLSLIEGGVMEAHPHLRFAFLESGCGWLPYWLWRLDHVEYAQYAAEVRTRVRRAPSEYFRRQCWIALEPAEALLQAAVGEIGASHVVFGTDFPHLDHETGIVGELMARRRELGDVALRAILWDNPCRLMGIDPDNDVAQPRPPAPSPVLFGS